jgi:hypothetical protein
VAVQRSLVKIWFTRLLSLLKFSGKSSSILIPQQQAILKRAKLWSLLPGKVTLYWRVTYWIRAV